MEEKHVHSEWAFDALCTQFSFSFLANHSGWRTEFVALISNLEPLNLEPLAIR